MLRIKLYLKNSISSFALVHSLHVPLFLFWGGKQKRHLCIAVLSAIIAFLVSCTDKKSEESPRNNQPSSQQAASLKTLPTEGLNSHEEDWHSYLTNPDIDTTATSNGIRLAYNKRLSVKKSVLSAGNLISESIQNDLKPYVSHILASHKSKSESKEIAVMSVYIKAKLVLDKPDFIDVVNKASANAFTILNSNMGIPWVVFFVYSPYKKGEYSYSATSKILKSESKPKLLGMDYSGDKTSVFSIESSNTGVLLKPIN